ncbi:MAG TPA: hypothetical protein VHV30_07980 [Polyangiaceae bacterium]|jgi:hypothetical protein|nr:hypothetical protein [Polyangiaceae bacterium]
MVCASPSSRLPRGAFAALAFALRLGVLLLPAAVMTTAAVARAGDGRVLVIDVDSRVADALVVALSPWSLTVVRAPGPIPAPDFDAASARARVMAADQHAGAVVWLVPPRPPDEQPTLWVYDAQTLELTVRPLSVWAPFDDARAAAVALSVKTVLRASPLVAPEPAPEPPPAPPAVARPPPAPVVEAAEPSAGPPARTARWWFETFVGGRAPTGASVEARASVGGSFWPASLAGHVGIGVDVQAGPGVSIATGRFQGELRQASVDVNARLRSPVTSWLALELDGGPGVVLASLDGQAAPGETSEHALRLDPALDLGAIADFTFTPRVSVGAQATGAAFLRFQRYSLDGGPLLDAPPIVMLFGARLSVGID